MEKVQEIMKAMGALPKLRLGEKLQGGGVKSFGPKEVRFLSEPVGVTKNDHKGKPQKMLRFEVENNGTKCYWYVKVLNEQGEANYLLEQLSDIKVGDTRTLEMMKHGAKNYIDIRGSGEPARLPDEDDGEDIIRYDEETETVPPAPNTLL